MTRGCHVERGYMSSSTTILLAAAIPTVVTGGVAMLGYRHARRTDAERDERQYQHRRREMLSQFDVEAIRAFRDDVFTFITEAHELAAYASVLDGGEDAGAPNVFFEQQRDLYLHSYAVEATIAFVRDDAIHSIWLDVCELAGRSHEVRATTFDQWYSDMFDASQRLSDSLRATLRSI